MNKYVHLVGDENRYSPDDEAYHIEEPPSADTVFQSVQAVHEGPTAFKNFFEPGALGFDYDR